MKKQLVIIGTVIYLAFGSLPLFWPLPDTVKAATATPGLGTTADPNSNAQDNAALLNQYLSQQQATTGQQATAAQQQTNAQNTKLVWPWWVKVFATAAVVNSVIGFFALAFGLAALWKWLAFKRE